MNQSTCSFCNQVCIWINSLRPSSHLMAIFFHVFHCHFFIYIKVRNAAILDYLQSSIIHLNFVLNDSINVLESIYFLGFNKLGLFILICHFPDNHLSKIGSVQLISFPMGLGKYLSLYICWYKYQEAELPHNFFPDHILWFFFTILHI